MHRFFKAVVAAAALVFCASPALAGVVIGTIDASPLHANSAPFGSLQASFFYQQVYDDSAFSGPITISRLTFYNTMLPGGTPNPGSFQIYLDKTAQQVGGIVNNIPDLSTPVLVFDGALPALSNERLDFLLSQTFTYNPATDGNLLLIVRNFNFTASPSPLFLDSDTSNVVTSSRHYSGPSGPTGNLRTGLVTGFNDVATVPEPSSWSIAAAALVCVGFLAVRRRPKFPTIQVS